MCGFFRPAIAGSRLQERASGRNSDGLDGTMCPVRGDANGGRAMTSRCDDTCRPPSGPFSPASPSSSLFLGEPLARTPNLAVHCGLGSTPFAARRIPLTAECCAVAREFTRAALYGWNLHGVCDDTVQIASELVANAVRHGRTRTSAPDTSQAAVWLALTPRPHTLLCVVRDPSRRLPRYTPPAPLAERNRGLPIVRALAASWGWTNDSQAHGKTVWARVALP
ncbi:ATP-binding protein [Streptomyces sp. G45]|uniref:ATP-binding protein n=1 Tax=Streptomyces sp. G45 TaxID=3406627 RepID=UPI003C28880B